MGGVDKVCHGGKVGADSVEGVTDVVAENLLAVLALEEVVSVGVEGAGSRSSIGYLRGTGGGWAGGAFVGRGG